MINLVDIEILKSLAIKAGLLIMDIYKEDFSVKYKYDNTPLTRADILSNQLICKTLHTLYPNIPILSEENKEISYNERKEWEYYWCIDPIDGTKEFIKRNNEFTVNIALIYLNNPILGVVYAPALHKLYYAQQNKGAYLSIVDSQHSIVNSEKLPLTSQNNLKEKITVVVSKSHLSSKTQEFIDNLAHNTSNLEITSIGSSLKLCMVATGEADIYPRLAPTMEWDTAAAHVIVVESGKNVYAYNTPSTINHQPSTTDNRPSTINYIKTLPTLSYNKTKLVNQHFICM